MSFFKSIGRAFGFGGDYDEDEVIESEYDETSAAESVAGTRRGSFGTSFSTGDKRRG